MSAINYNDYFKQPVEKDGYVVQLTFVSPKKDLNLNELPEGIDINKTFGEAVEKFNTHSGRRIDGAKISAIEINNKCIYFTVKINKGKLTKMRSLVGNSLSKWLYAEYNWKCLISENSSDVKQKLFSIDYKNL